LRSISESTASRNATHAPDIGAGAAIGLDDVAIERDLTFAEQPEVGHGAQAAPDEPLDLLRAPRLLTLGGLAIAAGMGCAREHSVFGGHPAFTLSAQPGRQALLYRGGDEHAGLAERDQA
jgi:hypothetical protein